MRKSCFNRCPPGLLTALLVSLVVAVLFTPGRALADETSAPAASAPAPLPANDGADRLWLTSGELLKGRLKGLSKNKIAFKSQALGELEIPLKDIERLVSRHEFNIRLKGEKVLRGRVALEDGRIRITGSGPTRQVELKNLIALGKNVTRERDFWSGNAALGLNLASGNTDQTQWSAIVRLKRQTLVTRFKVDYVGNFTKTDGVESANSQLVDTGLDWFLTERWYLKPVFFQYYRNPFSNISNRYTAGAGLGYRLLIGPRFEWDIEAGPAWRRTEYSEVPAGEKSFRESPAAVLSTLFTAHLTDSTDFSFNYGVEFTDKSSGTFTHHLLTTLTTSLAERLNFNTSFGWDRVEDPRLDAQGQQPDRDDFYLIFGLGFDL